MKKSMVFIVPAILFSILVIGCGEKSDITTRYEMEKKLNETDRLKSQMGIKGEKLSDSDVKSLVSAYLNIAHMTKLPEDSVEVLKADEEKTQTWELAMLAYTRVGTLYYDKRDYENAYNYFKIIIDTPSADPAQRGAAFNYMASCREKEGKYEEAAALYDSLAAGYPGYTEPQNPNIDALNAPIKAAEMWQKLGNGSRYTEGLEQARTYYNMLLPKHPDTPFQDAVLGKIVATYLRQNKFTAAVNMLEKTRDDKTGLLKPRVMMMIADIYMNNMKDYSKAEKIYRDFVKQYPDQPEIAPMGLGLGLALFQQGKFTDSREAVKNIEKLPDVRTSTVAEAYFLTALCYEKEGSWEKAIGQFDLVQATFPGTDKAFDAGLHVANYYRSKRQNDLSRQKFEETANYIEKYTDPQTNNPAIASRAMGYLVRCYTEMGEINEAISTLEELYDRYPLSRDGAFAPLRLADIYENDLKDNQKAIHWLEIFIRDNPDVPDTVGIKAHIKELEKS